MLLLFILKSISGLFVLQGKMGELGIEEKKFFHEEKRRIWNWLGTC